MNRLLFSLLFANLFYSVQLYAQTTGANNRIVPVLELKGTAYQRGFLHGRQLKNEISEVYAKWKKNIATAIKGDADSVLAVFLASTDFLPAIRKFTPTLEAELNGIAEGSGQRYEDVYGFQLVDEFWVYLDRQFNIANHHCSGLGIPATKHQPAYIAQNVDLESYMNGYQVLFHIAGSENEPEQYILSCAGLLALTGMNGAGTGVCVNTLMELQASNNGLPVAFVIRGLLAKKKGTESLTFLQKVPHASGQNYIIGTEDSVYDFETSSTQVIRFIPNNSSQIVYHTNHALVNHDVKPWYKNYHGKVLAGQTATKNSEIRFASLEKYLSRQPDDISTDLIKTALRSKDQPLNPVCRPFKEGAGFTFSSVIYTLGGQRSVQITFGSPDQSDYQQYFFTPPNN